MKYLLLVVIYISPFTSLFCQEELNREVIDVVKDFRPKVMLANKIHSQPLFIDTSKVSTNLKYNVRFEEFRVQQKLDSLKVKEIDRLLLKPLLTKRLSLELGNFIIPNLFFGVSEGRNIKSMYHAFLNFNGAYSNFISNEDKYRNLCIGGLFQKIFRPFIINSRVSLKDITRFDSKENDFNTSIFSLGINISFNDSSKFYIPKKIFISNDLLLRDLLSSERKFVLVTQHHGINEHINSWKLKNLLEFQTSNSVNYFHLSTDVNIEKETDKSNFILGLNSDFLLNQLRFFPKLQITRGLINNDLFSYFEIGGSRDLYSLQNIYLSNPYISNSQLLFIIENNLFSNIKYFTRVGLNGDLFNGVRYQFSVTASNENNYMHFTSFHDNLNFINYTASFTKVNMFTIHNEIEAILDESILSTLKSDFRFFDKELSYVPKIELGFYSDYYYNDEWFLSSSFRYLGSRSVLFLSQSEMNSYIKSPLKNIFDFNISLNYNCSSSLRFHIKVLNLLNEDYVYWQENPVFGRQLNLGANYRF